MNLFISSFVYFSISIIFCGKGDWPLWSNHNQVFYLSCPSFQHGTLSKIQTCMGNLFDLLKTIKAVVKDVGSHQTL